MIQVKMGVSLLFDRPEIGLASRGDENTLVTVTEFNSVATPYTNLLN
ncbi:hypothetical protein [Pseudoalteromonas rubra]|nr:hypothetical protein [Pseudoalteromonas rubra]MEC4091394.1 hypothetical protein [Pseudoalteromonas rubra]